MPQPLKDFLDLGSVSRALAGFGEVREDFRGKSLRPIIVASSGWTLQRG